MKKVISLICFNVISLTLIFNGCEAKAAKNYTEIASNEELEELSQELFELSDNSLLSQIALNLQGRHETFNSTDDLAPEPLLTLRGEYVESDTIRHMQMLYDNYERNSSVEETVTDEEMSEESDFINALLQTAVMRRAMNFLESKSLVERDPESHFCLLKKLWFDLYPRGKGRNATSSGFEHVFLAESKRTKLMGFHNWVYLAAMERSGALNYKGWERTVDLGDKAKIIKIKFDLDGMRKAVSSMFVGTQPELEIALYTLCFKLRVNRKCTLAYDDVKFNVTAYSLIHQKKRFVASAFVLL